MNILIPVIGLGPSGGNRVLCNLATEWINSGHNVTFLSHESGGPVYFPTKAKIIWFNTQSEIGTKPDYSAKKLRFRQTIWLLLQLLKKTVADYDVILINHSLTVVPAILAGARKKAFYYIQLYEPDVFFASQWLINKLRGVVLWATYFMIPKERCIVNSKIYVNYKNIRTNGKVIHPGIDLELYWQKKFNGIPKQLTLGIIGRKAAFKGTSQGVDVLRSLVARGVDVRLKVAFHLSQEIIKGIEDRIEVVTPQNDNELANFYRSVDIMLALGTIQLGAPHYPVIESLSCGTLVITTGYLPADEETSYIVPINDAERTADVVEEIAREDMSILKTKITAGRLKTLPLAWHNVATDMLDYIINNQVSADN